MGMTYTNEQIETEAIRLCKALGLDPFESVGHAYYDTYTSAELQEMKTDVIFDVMLYSPLWMLYRSKAAESLAIRGIEPSDY
jgi:hypothetical protein